MFLVALVKQTPSLPKSNSPFCSWLREGAAFVSFQILQCYPNSSVLEEHDQGVLRAGPITGIAVLEVTSLELFGVNQTIITGIQVRFQA